MTDEQAMAATPHTELISELMNPNNPKNEREHAAVREIERLQEAMAQKQEWIGLTEQERNDIEDYCEMMIGKPAFDAIEQAVKEKNWSRRMRLSAEGVQGVLIYTGGPRRYMFRVYTDNYEFTDYDLHHSDLSVIITDKDATLYKDASGNRLDHSPATLGAE